MSVSSLVNLGFFVNKNDESRCKSIVVIGCARGGTSIVSGMLHHMGVPMPGATDPVYEDLRLSWNLECDKLDEVKAVIAEYNQHFQVWGWKRPSLIYRLEQIDELLDNPFYIFVFRDVFSIANRNRISMSSDMLASMRSSLNEYSLILDFIQNKNPSHLMCSVEKLKQYPEDFCNGLAEFIDFNITEDNKRKAVSFIQPEPEEYLESSRINRGEGQIGGIRNGTIFGWAAWAYRDEEVSVGIFVNSRCVAEVMANDFREHSREHKNRRYGYCGYSYDLHSIGVKKGDLISVKISGEVKYLKGSNITLNESHLVE